MNRQIAIVALPLEIPEGPARVRATRLVSGIGADCRVAEIDAAGRLVVYMSNKASAAASKQAPIPRIRQKLRKSNFFIDDPRHATVRHANWTALRSRDWHGLGDPCTRQLQ